MKKVLAIVAVVCVVCAAGAAFAQQSGKQHLDQRRGPQVVQNMPNPHVDQRFNPQFEGGEGRGKRFGPQEFCGRHCGRRGEPRGMMFAPDMPEEIKAKVVEAEKLKIDLDAALSAKPIDKAKAMEIFGQIQKAEQEIEAWKFGKKLERIEAFRTQQELNRKKFPEQKPEAPAPEAPAEKAE